MKFKRLTEEVFSLYSQEKYNQALEVVRKAKSEYPKKLHKTSHWSACLYNKLNRHREAIDELKNTFNKGFWWAPKLLTEDPDLKPLNDKKEFKELVSKCKKLRDERQSNAKPKLKVLSPEKKKNINCPLIIILHGRNGNIKEFSKYWDIPNLRDDYLLAFLQSSQVFGMNSYCWDDIELAKKEVKEQYNNIVQNYKVDTNNIIIAGASQGGRLAIQLALERNIFCGFIGVIPAISEVDKHIESMNNSVKSNMKSVMITGDNDRYYPKVKQLYKRMNELDYPIKLITEKGMGHYISEKFPKHIKSALKLIFKE
ncbi:MAG: alpha/beta hydrolase [Bacillota bacterium]